MDRPLPQLDQLAMGREVAERSYPEGRDVVLVRRISRHRCDANSAAAGRDVEESAARMRPGVLNAAGECDGRAFGQCGSTQINFVVRQLTADTRIEGAIVFGLCERQL